MKTVYFIVILALTGLSLCQSGEPADTSPPIVESDQHRVDLRVEHLNGIFRDMNVGEKTTIKLADDSYYEMEKSSEKQLNVQVMLYSPGDEDYKMAFQGSYIYNELAQGLIATVCKEHPITLKPTETPVECEDGIYMASRIIGLELEGTVDLEGYQSENLEKCIAAKLPPKLVEKPYTKCVVKILGDPKYVGESLKAKLKSLKDQGYECMDNGECYKAEDPQVFADLLEEFKGQPVQIEVPNDNRPRFCKLKSHPLMAQDLTTDLTEYIESYNYSCNYWVDQVFCKVVDNTLFFTFSFMDNKGDSELLQTHPFNVLSANQIAVDWRNNVRINSADFYSDSHSLAVQEIQFNFSDGSTQVCGFPEAARPDRTGLNKIEVGLAGEIAGLEYARLAKGIRIKNVIERT